MSDIIEINEIDFENDPSLKSQDFGGGLELLMNTKSDNKRKSSDTSIGLEDITNLENELNNLVEEDISLKNHDEINERNYNNVNVRFDENIDLKSDSDNKHEEFNNHSSLGEKTSEQPQSGTHSQQTWDGYRQYNNISENPDVFVPNEPKKSPEELLREKFKYLRLLEGLEKKGIELSKKYSMESDLMEIKGEYETIVAERKKRQAIKFQGNMLMACVNGIEFLNNRFDPCDINLDGWGEQVSENIEDYEDIFSALDDKYSSKANMSPEIQLLFHLGGSGMMVHMTNSMFKSSMPGTDEILKQNPDLMKQFQSAAVNSMSQTNPGFSNFVGNMMSDPIHKNNSPSVPPSQRAAYMPSNEDYVNQSSRPEMKGPSDVSSLLSNIKTKTKTINIPEHGKSDRDSSTISISDLKDMNSTANLPKKSKRRQTPSNTISLDI